MFGSKLLDPADTVTIRHKWLDQKQISACLSDQPVGFMKGVRRRTNLALIVSAHQGSQSLLANDCVAHYHDAHPALQQAAAAIEVSKLIWAVEILRGIDFHSLSSSEERRLKF